MARGKQTCKILKEIRRQIAEANDIKLVTEECRYKGDCYGTCPKCEAEVRYLEHQLRARSLAGKAVNIVGVSAATIALMMPMGGDAQSLAHNEILPDDATTETSIAPVKVKGTVIEKLTNGDSRLNGVSVINRTRGGGIATDINGNFEIDACPGDSLQLSYVGFLSKTIAVTDPSEPIIIELEEDSFVLPEGIIIRVADPYGMLDLILLDEKGNPIDQSTVLVSRVFIDEDGDEDTEFFDPIITSDGTLRYLWDSDPGFQDEHGKPLKKITLLFEAEGYEPVKIKFKYSKKNTRKTIRFKHQK